MRNEVSVDGMMIMSVCKCTVRNEVSVDIVMIMSVCKCTFSCGCSPNFFLYCFA